MFAIICHTSVVSFMNVFDFGTNITAIKIEIKAPLLKRQKTVDT